MFSKLCVVFTSIFTSRLRSFPDFRKHMITDVSLQEKVPANATQTPAYSPFAIVNIFNNALNNSSTKSIVQVRGIYTKGRGTNYNGFYAAPLSSYNRTR